MHGFALATLPMSGDDAISQKPESHVGNVVAPALLQIQHRNRNPLLTALNPGLTSPAKGIGQGVAAVRPQWPVAGWAAQQVGEA